MLLARSPACFSTWCVIRVLARTWEIVREMSSFHLTGNPKSSMVSVIQPLLTFASVLLFYAITPFNGSIISGAVPPVSWPIHREMGIACCKLSDLAEILPANGAPQHISAHSCLTPKLDTPMTFLVTRAEGVEPRAEPWDLARRKAVFQLCPPPGPTSQSSLPPCCIPAFVCLTPMLYAIHISGGPSEQRDAVYWNMDSKPLQCYLQPCPRPQSISQSSVLRCRPSPPPYANTPSTITPFFTHTTSRSSHVDVPSSPNTIQWTSPVIHCSSLFSLPSPPPTTWIPDADKCSSALPTPSLLSSFFSFTTFAQCLAKVCPAFIQSSAHSWLAIKHRAAGQPNHSNSITAEVCAEVCAEACAKIWPVQASISAPCSWSGAGNFLRFSCGNTATAIQCCVSTCTCVIASFDAPSCCFVLIAYSVLAVVTACAARAACAALHGSRCRKLWILRHKPCTIASINYPRLIFGLMLFACKYPGATAASPASGSIQAALQPVISAFGLSAVVACLAAFASLGGSLGSLSQEGESERAAQAAQSEQAKHSPIPPGLGLAAPTPGCAPPVVPSAAPQHTPTAPTPCTPRCKPRTRDTDQKRTVHSRQTPRSRAYALRRERQTLAASAAAPRLWRAMFSACHFCHKLRRRVLHRRTVLARCSFLLRPSCGRFVSLLRARRRLEALRLLQHPPRPILHDVGYDPATGQFVFRNAHGVVSAIHPATTSPDASVPAFAADGTVAPPLSPPANSSVVLCPEASGAWCYYDTALGTSSWFPPSDSTPLVSRHLCAVQLPPELPPLLPRDLQLNALRFTNWTPFFRDATNEVLLMHTRTGAVRHAPWIVLRTSSGLPYFANLVTHETRWLPPHRWMESWVCRKWYGDITSSTDKDQYPCPGWQDSRAYDDRLPLVGLMSRQCVEGGAPYLHERGKPSYPPDEFDTPLTYPLDGYVQVTKWRFPPLGVPSPSPQNIPRCPWVLSKSVPALAETTVAPNLLGYLDSRCAPDRALLVPPCNASSVAADAVSLAAITPAVIAVSPVRRWCRNGRHLSSRT